MKTYERNLLGISQTLLWLSCFARHDQSTRETEQVSTGPADLVAVPGDCDEQAEGRAGGERTAIVPLLRAPAAMLEGVNNHVTGVAIVARVKMESNICVGPRTALQVHVEPEEKQMNISSKINTFRSGPRSSCVYLLPLCGFVFVFCVASAQGLVALICPDSSQPRQQPVHLRSLSGA